MSQSKSSTVFCKLELHSLSKKTMLKISLNPGLNLTIFLGTGPGFFKIRTAENVENLLRSSYGEFAKQLCRCLWT